MVTHLLLDCFCMDGFQLIRFCVQFQKTNAKPSKSCDMLHELTQYGLLASIYITICISRYVFGVTGPKGV